MGGPACWQFASSSWCTRRGCTWDESNKTCGPLQPQRLEMDRAAADLDIERKKEATRTEIVRAIYLGIEKAKEATRTEMVRASVDLGIEKGKEATRTEMVRAS